MASLDVDQKFLGRIAKQTANTSPLLSNSLYQILGLSVLLSRRLVRARKLRKLDTSRDTPSLAAYQHILWLSREGLSILELYVLPYAQDNQHGPECRVLSVKLRASFYHIFCLFHNQPPVTATNMPSTATKTGMPSLPTETDSHTRKGDSLSPPSKRTGKQPTLREPIDSITSETSFLTNPYAAGGPVATPSPGPPNAPPGLNPIPIPQPSSFILPPLNFVPLASGYFTTATAYASAFLPGSHPLRLSVALEHSAFLWDCVHDNEGSRRLARRAIKDVYRAQEAMEDSEFEDAAELVGILGRMMKRKSWEGTPHVGGTSPAPPDDSGTQGQGNGVPVAPASTASYQSPKVNRRAAEGPPIQDSPARRSRSRSSSTSKSRPAAKIVKPPPSHEGTPRTETYKPSVGSQENTPRVGYGSQDTTPRARHTSIESDAHTTPRARPLQSQPHPNTRSPATPSTHGTPKVKSRSPTIGPTTPLTPSAAAALASDSVRRSPTLRRSPPLNRSPQRTR